MIELVIDQRRRDLGGFEVGRVLPFAKRRMVGPFVFFDHMGPVDFPPGIPRSVDVRPHPHIGLATLTYLFAGEIMHRDSLGSEQPIRPGEVNWMTAGRGITHSERFERARREGGHMDGIQAWVALPDGKEEAEPSFSHHAELPLVVGQGADVAAPSILPLIAERPRLAARVDALIRVDERRWDVRLKDGALIRLPAQDEEAALIALDGLDPRRGLFERGFDLVDLRTAGAVVVRDGAAGAVPPEEGATGASA